jgi:GxxExxY protein
MQVHSTLGTGFTEYVYQDALEVELALQKIPFSREVPFVVVYKNQKLKHHYIADFVVGDKIIIELKAVREFSDNHKKQVLNYLAISGFRLGLLVNFGSSTLTTKRVVL